MKRLMQRAAAAALSVGMLGLLGCAQAAREVADDPTLAIVGATVLPMTGARPITNAVVLVAGDRIQAVGPVESVPIPAGAQVIEAEGRYLVPGLVDMHAHLPPDSGEPGSSGWRQLSLMVANGVTTARGMAGQPGHPALRDAILTEDRIAPTLYVASPALHQGNTTDIDAALAQVRAAKDAGYDLIKSHHIEDPSVWQAIQEEARRLGMPVAGHLASTIELETALRAGQQIEHLDGYLMALLPEDSPARQMPFGQIPPPPVMQAIDADRIAGVAQQVAELNGWNVPTLALFEKIADTETPTDTLRARPEMKTAAPAALDQWAAQRSQLLAAGIMQAVGPAFVDLRRQIVAALQDAGAGIMAGSDTPQAFHLSGYGLHEELAALQRAGLTPLEALATATRQPRQYLASLPNHGSAAGRRADLGIIARGERADLVLLVADPSQDVAATRQIEAVVLRGRWLDRDALDQLVAEVEASVAPVATAAAGTAILVRHGAVDPGGSDPALSDIGHQQAAALARRFADLQPRAVYATPTRRARETAAPLAAAAGVAVTDYHPGQLPMLAEAIRREGGNVVVVGHSNTTPLLVEMLGGEPGAPIAEHEFDRIYAVTLQTGDTRIERPSASGATIAPCTLPGVAPPVRCGVVKVPESTGPGRMLEVHFAVLRATDQARLPPLLVAPGGPGLGGVQSAGGIAQLFAAFRADRDILLMDQRGTGASNRLDCELPTDLAGAIASLSSQDHADVVACRDQLSQRADLAAYTTTRAVEDLDRIRHALGHDRIDIFGMSYGTRVATEYARLFPDHLRAMVIRAPAPAAMQLPLHTPRDAQQSLERVIAACQAQPACAAAYPELASDVATILDQLAAGPVSVTVTDPRTGQPVTTAYGPEAFGSTMFFLLYIPEYYRQMPALVHAAATGDYQPLVQTVAPLIVGTLDQVAWGLRWSVICNEDVARIDRSRVAELTRGTFFGDTPIAGDTAACDLWPDATVDPGFFEPPSTDHPVLIISGTMDPVAPPRWGEHMARTLDNVLHLPIEGASHLPVFPGCTAGLVEQFLNDAQLASLDSTCAAEPQVPPFLVRSTP